MHNYCNYSKLSYYIIDKYDKKKTERSNKRLHYSHGQSNSQNSIKEKNPKTIRKIKYLIESKTIDFDSNSLQTEKANAFSILRIFF